MAEEPDPLVGLKIQQYVLVRVLGRGAMGLVYLARHSETQQEVAIKFLSGEFETKPEFVTRFMNEAAACSRLDHENIVRVYEAGQEDGTHFMVMEYVEGVDLGHFLQVQDKVKEAQALPWLKQSSYALAYAHKQNIVHRDLKPENIMINKDGVVKVADLGLSKTLGEMESLSMTMSGTVIGTPYYISPEQARDAKRVDIRTDIYSLGATFYHLLTGRPPFQGNSAAEVMSKHMNETLVDPGRVNIALSDGICILITKMMEKEPARRFQTLEELIEAIERLERGEEAIPGRVKLRRNEDSRVTKTSIPLWKRFSIRKMAVAAAISLVATFLAFIIFSSPKKSQPLPLVRVGTPGVMTPTNSPGPGGSGEKPILPVDPVPSPGTVTNTTPTGPELPDGMTSTNAPPTLPSPGIGMVPSTNQMPVAVVQPGGTNTAPIKLATTEIPRHPPKPPKKPPVDEEAVYTNLAPQAASTTGAAGVSFHSLNWVDGILLLVIWLGVPATQKVGWIWGTIRAGAFWLAMYILLQLAMLPSAICLQSQFNFPAPVAVWITYLVLSGVVMLTAWVSTQRLYGTGKDKDSLRNKIGRTIAILPGVVLGGSFAVWTVTLMMFLNSSDLPAATSWSGTWVKQTFPAVEDLVKKSVEKGKPEKEPYR